MPAPLASNPREGTQPVLWRKWDKPIDGGPDHSHLPDDVARPFAAGPTRRMIHKITHQAAGAFGEKAVEAELLRHNWIPANVNATVKNAAKFDIYALKGNRSVQIQVKTCRPDMPAFLCSGFQPGKPITSETVGPSDFTIVVRMGNQHGADRFYVLPTTVA